MNKKIYPIVSIILLAIVWQLLALWINQPEIFPSLIKVIQRLVHFFTTPTFYLSIGATLLRGVGGICFSLLLAFTTAIFFNKYKWVNELLQPVLTIMRSVPVISFILLALIFLNPESIPFLIAFLTMYPLLTENLTNGIRSLQTGLSEMATLYQFSSVNYITQILYPQLKPFLFSGLASAMGFGWRAIIMGEVLSQCNWGIGSEMKKAQIFIEVPDLLAWTIIAILISYLADRIIRLSEKYNFPIYFNVKDRLNKRKNALPQPILQIENISFKYNDRSIFKNDTFIFEANKIYGIAAPSGAGKTTLLKLISGILLPQQGKIINEIAEGIPIVSQSPHLLPHLSARQNIIVALASTYTFQEANVKAEEILKELELGTYINSLPEKLSYGQQQRLAIARALVYPSPLLLMDEPFKGLEQTLVNKIIDYIRNLQKETGQLIIFTSHNPDELNKLADQILYL